MRDQRPGGVGVYFISHVGGHKYAANVLVYRRGSGSGSGEGGGKRPVEVGEDGGGGGGGDGDGYQTANGVGTGKANANADAQRGIEGTEGEGAAQCIWLARVRPEDCEAIVKFTVMEGKVVKPGRQLRGGFDRGRGVVSW